MVPCVKASDSVVSQVDSAFETYDKFFNLELDVKQKYAKTESTSTNGWDALERERLVLTSALNLLTPRVKPWVIQTCDSMDKMFKCDPSLESC